MTEKVKMIKLTPKQIRDKSIQLANAEFEGDLAKVKIKHFKRRLADGTVDNEGERQIEQGAERIKMEKERLAKLRKQDPHKEALAGLKQLESLYKTNERNIKAFKIQLRDGEQPDFIVEDTK